MLNTEFLNEILANGDVSQEDKIKAIIAEHDADTRGLVAKRDELLESGKKLKEQLKTFENEKSESDSRISKLEEELKKNSPEEHKKYYEAQLADISAKHTEELKKVLAERDFYKENHLALLKNKAIENGVKDLNFVDGLREGFIARILSMNAFEPQEIDGKTIFLNKDHRTIDEAINAFVLTSEGKSYIRNPSSGGGARGGEQPPVQSNKNPFKKGSENLTEQMRLFKQNKAEYDRLKAEANL